MADPRISILVQAIDQTKAVFQKISANVAKMGDKIKSVGNKITTSFKNNIKNLRKLSQRIRATATSALLLWMWFDRVSEQSRRSAERHATLSKMTRSVDEAQRALNSAIEESGPASEAARKAAEELTEKQRELKVAQEEAKAEAGRFNITMGIGVVTTIATVVDAVLGFIDVLGTARLINAFKGAASAASAAASNIAAAIGSSGPIGIAIAAIIAVVGGLVIAWQTGFFDMETATRDTTYAVQDLEDALGFLEGATGDLRTEQKEIQWEMAKLKDAFNKGEISEEEYKDEMERLRKKMDELSAKGAGIDYFSSRIKDLKKDYDDGKISQEEFRQGVEDLMGEITEADIDVGEYGDALDETRKKYRDLIDATKDYADELAEMRGAFPVISEEAWKGEVEPTRTWRGRQFGGPIFETGLYRLHRGEFVLPAPAAGAVGKSVTVGDINVYVTKTGATPEEISRAIAERLERLIT